MSYIYLAAPYTSPDNNVMEYRYDEIISITGQIARYAVPVYSPIAHWHVVAGFKNLPKDAAFWARQNESLMVHAEECWILTIEGWEASLGVRAEVAFFEERARPVRYLTPSHPDSLTSLCRAFVLNHYNEGHI